MHKAAFLPILAFALSACTGDEANVPAAAPSLAHAFTANSDIAVRDAVRLPAQLSAQRVPVGVSGDYKPDLALLPDGTLLLVMFQPQNNSNGTYQENVILYRSLDGGQTWGPREVLDLLGREPYFTVLKSGVILITSQLITPDYRDTLGYNYALVHRSEDGGRTWSSMPIMLADVPGATAVQGTLTSRTILAQADGSLLMGVSSGPASYTWRSYDDGMTWDKSQQATISNFNPSSDGVHCLYGEMVFWATQTGAILGMGRLADNQLPEFPDTVYPSETTDNTDRMALYRSADDGVTWTMEGAIGDNYGQMYPSLLKMADGRLLFTFTDRALLPPLGVDAVLGAEAADGFSVDFAGDRLLIDEKTPAKEPSGGGFGNTVQLADQTLVTSYSYRDSLGVTHAEVARWLLPL
jgi:hypothetical protein